MQRDNPYTLTTYLLPTWKMIKFKDVLGYKKLIDILGKVTSGYMDKSVMFYIIQLNTESMH